MGLTIKQEKFCMVYIETSNASEAYRQAYNCENMKENSINVNASKLLADAKITLRLEELRKEHAERHNLTINDLIRELEEARKAALSALPSPQSSAAVAATMGKAKLLGLDKGEQKEEKPKENQKVIIEVVDARKNAKTE
jgi:phage terminase small subunit